MHQQTRKLFDLVNQLLDFRKVESGHVTLRASQKNLTAFLTEIFLIFKLKADEQELDYSLDVPTAPILLYFDSAKLEIILTNLLSNAFKYTDKGGKIRLSAQVAGTFRESALFKEGQLEDNYVEIIVQDRGIGMNLDEVDKIFDPYYQASQTETLRMIGTGIGLSLVKQFVERHKGTISVKSNLGYRYNLYD